jgi:hypothetical protein
MAGWFIGPAQNMAGGFVRRTIRPACRKAQTLLPESANSSTMGKKKHILLDKRPGSLVA